MINQHTQEQILATYQERAAHFEEATAINCMLEGWTYGHLPARAYAGFDTWRIVSDCGQVTINVLAHIAEHRVADSSTPHFYYE